MELRDYLRILRKGWIVMLAVTIAGLVGGAIASLVSPTVYSSTAKVLVSVTSPEDVTAAELTQANALAQRKAIAYVNIVTSPDVLGPVVDDLGLDTTPAALATRITAASPATSGVIEIAATSSNAGQAADIANAVSSELSDFVDTVEKPQGGGESPVQLTVAQPAVAAASPTSPRTSLNLALGVLLGLALGVAAVLVRSVLDSRIHNLADVEAVTELPVLGGIAGARGPAGGGLVVRDDPNSAQAEAFRRLRTNLHALDFGGGPRSIVITSSLVGEGRTAVAANLAVALTDTGAKVALIDGDLRHPSLANLLGLEPAVGLTDVLTGRTPLAEALQQWGNGDLYVLPAGRFQSAPSDLLASQPMAQLLASLGAEFDYILIDAPPLLPVTDAVVLGWAVAGVLLVAAVGRVQQGELELALRSLDAGGCRVFGLVLTMLPPRGPNALGYGTDDTYYTPREDAAPTPLASTQ